MYLAFSPAPNRSSFAPVLNLGYAQAAVNSIVETSVPSGSNSAEQMPARVLEIRPEQSKLVCVFSSGREISLSRLVGSNIRIGDEILLPASTESATTDTEIYIRKPSSSKSDVYQVKVGYAALPKQDRRGEFFVRVQVVGGQLGINTVHIPCHVIRDYFFAANRSAPWSSKPSFYYLLHLPEDVTSKELRLGYRIRRIELRKENASKADLATIERAYNMLADPELRAVYNRAAQRSHDSSSISVLRIRVSLATGRASRGERCLLREPDSGIYARAPAPQGSRASPQTRLF